MLGRMMGYPLTITHFLERARQFHGASEIVARRPDKTLVRSTYADFAKRTARLCHALTKLGVKPGDRVATLCWNHGPHLEAYFGVPAMGAVIHTLNLRLHPTELAYIASHAEDKVVLVDRSLLPLYRRFAPSVRSIEHVIVVPDDGPVGEEDGLDYEVLLASEPDRFDYPVLDENTAAMLCYTSGTTGNPKGVLYSHRSTVLHSLVSCMTDTLGISEGETRCCRWCRCSTRRPGGCRTGRGGAGAKLVFPGPHLDPVSLLDLMAEEKVTFAAGVPTIWLGILAHLDQEPKRWDLSRCARWSSAARRRPRR
jgi:fatty-acyl-CoA synthase